MKQSLLFLLFSIGLGLAVLRPILPPSVWYPMHDATSPERITLMREAILNGQFPPLWASSINNGYGYPLFHFYAPLFHLTATLLSFVLPVTLALKTTLLFTTLVGALGMMQFASRWGRGASLVAAAALILSPFIALELYVRGAYAEYLSLCLLPWGLLATESLLTRRRVALAAVVLTLFVLSHNLIPLLALPMLLIWMLFRNRGRGKQVLATILLAIALSAWFTVPLIFERHFTRADEVARTTSYSQHFVAPWQLWDSTWGYGGSALGVEDGMAFKLGKLQIIVGLLGLALAALIRNKPLLILGSFLVTALFLSTSFAKFIWDALPLLQIVQFPWRTLGLVVVFLSLFSGFAASRVPTPPLRLLLLSLLIVGFWRFGQQYFVPQSYLSTSLTPQDISQVVPEYQPTWMPETPHRRATPIPATVTGPATISIDRAYYPTWRATLDGQPLALQSSSKGLIELNIPAGTYTFKLWQSHTKLEYFAYAVTLLALGVTIGLLGERV